MSGREQLPLDLPVVERLDDEDFLIDPSNAEAARWIAAWPDWPRGMLALAGPAASGKSHLARMWARRAGAVTVTMAELGADPAALVAQARAFVIDPVEPPIHERALLHFYNLAQSERRALLLVAEAPPAHWNIALPDLASRLATLALAEIGAPGDDLLASLVIKQARDRQLLIAPGLVAHLVARMERSHDAARRLVAELDRAGLARHRPITLALAREVLAHCAGDA